MSIHVKICGITDVEAALAAADAGADAVGFVFADSVRRISPSRAASIAAELGGRVELYAVFDRPGPGEVHGVLAELGADVVQADHESIAALDGLRLLPVFRQGGDAALGQFLRGGGSRRFHYEGRRSGSGERVDWHRASGLARRGRMTLAGGLDPGNVAEAIRLVRPFGVDVSSGVESAPGTKDPVRIRAFIEAVREVEREAVST